MQIGVHMTNTHRKTTTSTTAKIAAVGAFGIGAAIAFPGLAAAQTEAPSTPDTGSLESITGEDGSLAGATGEDGSLESLTGEDGSLEGALGTNLDLDLGSLALTVNLDAEAPTPGSIELGSLGVSPNTGSDAVDGGSAENGTQTGAATGDEGVGGSLDLGSLGSSEEPTADVAAAAADVDEDATVDEGTAEEGATTGSLSGSLAGLSSEAPADDAGETGDDAAAGTGSLG